LVAAQKTGVLFVSSAEHPGADTFIHALLMRGLDRSRFDVHVACSAGMPGARTPAFDALSTIPDLRLRPSNFGPSLSGRSRLGQAVGLLQGVPTLASFAGLARYIRHNRISVLHSTDRPRDAVSCVLLGKLTGAKSVVHVHVKFADWMGRSVRWAMDRADALVGVSKFVARSLVENGYSPQKTHAVLNAIDAAAWDFRLEPGPVRRALGIPDGAPVVACAGRLFRGKGQDHMIRAIPLIRREFPDVRLLVVGADDRQAMQTSFTAELKELARDLGVLDQVVFTGYRADMPAVLAACDVFALPSLEEPFGLVFLEALAMKKPVVALNNGGTPEVVEHSASGLLSAPGDQTALAANVMALLRDPALRASMGEYGRRQVEARFTTERMARDTEQVYAALAGSTSGSQGV
jgi:glycosyltransferase involved in cell wall biosynthesis